MATHTSFHGFQFPTTTPVPDELFDVLLPKLSGAELKVLLYICRRTLGFKKAADNISLHQIASGIKTRDGRVLDRGTGLSKAAVVTAVQSLEKKGIISKTRRQSVENGCEPTTYSLTFASLSTNQPWSKDPPEGCLKTKQGGVQQTRQGLVQKLDTQQTVGQETEEQETGVVVAVAKQLETFGIAKACATKLTKEYPQEYIREKVAMAEELVRSGSALVAKNPAGWLRRAIEEDYVPARNYQRQHQLIEEFQPAQTECLQTGATLDRDDRTENNEVERTTTAQETTGRQPSADAETTWNKTLKILKEQVPSHTFETWITNTALVSLEKSIAVIQVGSQLARQWLERRLYFGICRALSNVLHQDVEVQFVSAA